MTRRKPRKSDVAALKFSGGRYEGKGFPLDGIDELEKYQRLVALAAEKLWRDNNPHALRLPAKFKERVRLRLTRVDEGSVVPTLERDTQLDVGSFDLLQESVNYVDETFSQIVANFQIPADMPDNMLRALRLFGVSFRGNERATFRWGADNSIQYGQDTRQAFLTALKSEQTPVSGVLVGRIRMLDVAKKFILRDALEHNVAGSFIEAAIFDEFHQVHQYRDDADFVWVAGDLALDSTDNSVLRIDNVSRVGLFASGSNPWALPLARLSTYPDEWLDGDGRRVTLEALLAALGLLDSISDEGLQTPSVFAEVEGGVRLEWLDHDAHTSLTVDREAGYSGYHINIATGEEESLDRHVNREFALDFMRRQRA